LLSDDERDRVFGVIESAIMAVDLRMAAQGSVASSAARD
jgi:hypothetical protein